MNHIKHHLQQLISIPSTADNSHALHDCIGYVTQVFAKSSYETFVFESGNKPSIVIAGSNKNKYQYILNGHLDVVPASSPDAFIPTIRGTRMYGRGSADMKGGVVSLIMAMLHSEKKSTDTALMLTTDEEIGGSNGVRYLLESKGFASDCVIIPDGGNNFHLTMMQKGILHIKISTVGVPAHGSRPWQGTNAIDQLVEICTELRSHFPQPPQESWDITCNSGQIKGGTATNAVAPHAEIYLDFRFPDDHSEAKILSIIRDLIANYSGAKYEILVSGSAVNVSSKDPYVKKIKHTAAKYNIHLQPEKTVTASDARYFAKTRTSIIMFNPICSEGHMDEEWVDLDSLETHYQIITDFL